MRKAQGARDGVSPAQRIAAPSIVHSANPNTATIRTPCSSGRVASNYRAEPDDLSGPKHTAWRSADARFCR
jgi:hypothetical protein